MRKAEKTWEQRKIETMTGRIDEAVVLGKRPSLTIRTVLNHEEWQAWKRRARRGEKQPDISVPDGYYRVKNGKVAMVVDAKDDKHDMIS